LIVIDGLQSFSSSSIALRAAALHHLLRDGALSEAVPESTVDDLQVAHAAGPGGAAADGLDRPVVGSLLGSGVAARGTGVLLDVVGGASTAPAQGVGLVVALAERRRSLRHC